MKVISKVYKGIEYVQLGDLPREQQEKLKATVDPAIFIKILIENKVVANCIQYKDYSLWFDNVFKAPVPVSTLGKEVPMPSPEVNMAFGKAS